MFWTIQFLVHMIRILARCQILTFFHRINVNEIIFGRHLNFNTIYIDISISNSCTILTLNFFSWSVNGKAFWNRCCPKVSCGFDTSWLKCWQIVKCERKAPGFSGQTTVCFWSSWKNVSSGQKMLTKFRWLPIRSSSEQ